MNAVTRERVEGTSAVRALLTLPALWMVVLGLVQTLTVTRPSLGPAVFIAVGCTVLVLIWRGGGAR